MNQRTLAAAWILVGVLLVGGLLWELSAWRSLSSRVARATVERNRLTAELRQREQEIVKEMQGHAGLLQDLQSSAAGADPSVFLNRLAELAQGSRMRITAIGPLEKRSTAQFSKSWHSVQVTGPYRDIRELASRVERERGVLEDLVLEGRDAGQAAGSDDLNARFKMTALELAPEGKKIVDRALRVAGRGGEPGRGPSLSLPLPARTDGVPELRDPFLFGPSVALPRTPPPAPPSPVAALAQATAPPPRAEPAASPPETPMELRGIVGFPGGFLAILNNQIVKVGDSVAGHRVERISEREVVLRPPEGGTRVVPLPAVGAVGTTAAAPAARDASPPAPGTAPTLPRR